ncbi:SDR family NAD(P)-dependent oxidoreductase [Cupriavidus basilensis]
MEIDLTDAVAIGTLTERTGPLDALVNNAGMSDRTNLPVVEAGEDWQALLALNLEAPARLVDALSPRLAAGARVVNVASGAGLRAIPWRGAYSASKAGLIGMSRALARERPDLQVSVLCPGFVRTELVDRLIAAGRLDPARVTAKIPLGRMAERKNWPKRSASWPARTLRCPPVCCCRLTVARQCLGGSQGCAPATVAPVPSDTLLCLRVVGDVSGRWSAVGQHGDGYAAVLDVSPLAAPGGNRLAAVHEAARRFARASTQARLASRWCFRPTPARTGGTRATLRRLACWWPRWRASGARGRCA